MAGENPNLTVTALNINALNTPNKRQGFPECTKGSHYIFSMRSILYQNPPEKQTIQLPHTNPLCTPLPAPARCQLGKAGPFQAPSKRVELSRR